MARAVAPARRASARRHENCMKHGGLESGRAAGFVRCSKSRSRGFHFIRNAHKINERTQLSGHVLAMRIGHEALRYIYHGRARLERLRAAAGNSYAVNAALTVRRMKAVNRHTPTASKHHYPRPSLLRPPSLLRCARRHRCKNHSSSKSQLLLMQMSLILTFSKLFY